MLYLRHALNKAFLITILLSHSNAQTNISGLINSNTTWDSTGSPYIVVGNIAVMNATLTISPGVELLFNAGTSISVLTDAILVAEGSVEDSITFTGNGQNVTWHGIRFATDAIYSNIQSDTIYVDGSMFLYTKFLNVLAPNLDATNGGVFELEGSGGLYFRDCLFKNNTSPRAGCYSGKNGVFIDCDFIDNIATSNRGGGVMASEYGNQYYILRSKFINNSSQGNGSVGYFATANVKIIDCVFNNNISFSGSGAIYHQGGILYIFKSRFENNTGLFAGAIHSPYTGGEVYISKSEFMGNEATSGSAAMRFNKKNNLEIIGNQFINNVSGGAYASTCKFNSSGSFAQIRGNLFSRNISSGYSSAIIFQNYYSSPNPSIISENYFYGNIGSQSESSVIYGSINLSENTFHNNFSDLNLKFESGSTSLYNVENNYWDTKDSIGIANKIFDFYDDPNFNTAVADFVPFLYTVSDSVKFQPNTILSITLLSDSTYENNLADSIYVGSKLYLQLDGEDKNSYSPDLTPVYIINLSSQDTIVTTLVESGDSTGIFRSTAIIQNSTDNTNDIIGANVGDQIKIVSKTDTTKFYSFIVAQTPPPVISNLDVGGSDDIFHITSPTPNINWSYSDPLSSPQIKYNIQVGLDTNWTIAEMWDTGEISSSDNFSVYSGYALHEDSTYFIRVRVNNGTMWGSWVDTSFGLNSHPRFTFSDTSVNEDDTLFINLNDFISDSDDRDSLLNITSNGSNNIVVNIDTESHLADFFPVENWNGSEEIGFTCTDPLGFQTIDSLALSVLPKNDSPIVTTAELSDAIEDQEYSITIEATDADIIYGDSLAYSLSIYPVGMTIDAITGGINWMPDNNDVGDTTITVIVTDDSSATDSKTFSLLVRNTNDSPFITNPLQDIVVNEDADSTVIDLNGVFADDDIELAGDSLILNVSNDNVNLITTSLEGFTLTLSCLPDQNGTANIIVFVTDDSSSSVSDTFAITVNPINDLPVVSNPLADLTFDEDSEDIIIDLSNIFSDVDILTNGDSLSLVVINSDTTLITTTLNGDTLTLSTIYNQNGSSEIYVTATDDSSGSVSDTFTVMINPVNDPPILSSIPDTSFNEDSHLIIPYQLWYGYVDDIDNEDQELSWSFFSEDTINITVYPDSVLFHSPENWYGFVTVNVIVSDLMYNDTSSFVVGVTPMNDPPTILDIPNQSFIIDETIQLNLSDYISDPDLPNDSIIWNYTGGDSLLITLTNITAQITNKPDWVGIDSVLFIATDDGLESDSERVFIEALPIPAPQNLTSTSGLTYIPLSWESPDYTVSEELIYDDGDPSWVLTYFAPYKWATRMSPSWPCKILTLKYYHGISGEFLPGIYNWNNSAPGDMILEFAYSSTNIDTGWVTVDVSEYNITIDGDFVVSHGFLNSTVEFGYESGNNGRSWNAYSSWSPMNNYIYFIRAVVEQISTGLVFEMGYGIDKTTEIVNNKINGSDTGFHIENRDILSHYNVYRTDNIAGTYGLIESNITDTTYDDYSVSLGATYYYAVTSVFSDPPRESGFSNYTVATTAFPPILSTIPDTSFNEDDSLLVPVSFFHQFVSDEDTPDSVLNWQLYGSGDVFINSNDSIITFTSTHNWYGTEDLTIIVSDGLLSDTTQFTMTVLPIPDDPIVLNPMLDISFYEDHADSSIDLNNIFFDGDGDSLIFSFEGNSHITVIIVNGIVYLTPEINWSGQELIIFTANDMNGIATNSVINKHFTKEINEQRSANRATITDTLIATVISVNDPPVLSTILDTTLLEDDTLRLVLFAFDLDDDTLTFSAESDSTTLNTIVVDTFVTLFPNTNWNGVSVITIGVSDNDTTVTEQFTLTVFPVNDAPNPFNLISPIDSTIIQITQDNLNDTLEIVWESSIDVDGDTISYSLITTEGISFLTTDLILENESRWSFADLVDLMDTSTVVFGAWSVIVADNDTTTEASNNPFTLTLDATLLNIQNELMLPNVFALYQNYPNPFNPVTTIRYDIPMHSFVQMNIYDILGRQIRTLVNRNDEPGFKSVIWDSKNRYGESVSSGIYIYQIVAKSENGVYISTKKLVLLQ